MNVVFSINPLGIEGLGATLVSLLRNCSEPQRLKLWFFCSECKPIHKAAIKRLLQQQDFLGEQEFPDFDAKRLFGHLRSLHGDWTGYGRLLIPEYISADRALYLDSDLLVLLDVLQLAAFDFDGHVLAAAGGGEARYAMEHAFLLGELGIAPQVPYFNSGVLLLNLSAWREQNLQQAWQSLANKYPTQWLAIDQTILNALVCGRFAQLAPVFNNAWYPGETQPPNASQSILHFVGSPKPWDYFGRFLHGGHSLWKEYNPKGWEGQIQISIPAKLRRTWKIKNSIAGKLKQKWVGTN